MYTLKLVFFLFIIFPVTSFTQEIVGQEILNEESVSKEVIKNPWKRRIGDKVATYTKEGIAITEEMGKFYTATAIVEMHTCIVKNNPSTCTLFLEGLKDPIGHIGFALFMMSAKRISEYSYILSHGKIPLTLASAFGMAGGITTQEAFIEFVNLPQVKELIGLGDNTKYSSIEEKLKRKKELMGEIWHETFGNPLWQNRQMISFLSLFTASTLSNATRAVVAKGAQYAVAKATDGTLTNIAVNTNRVKVFANSFESLYSISQSVRDFFKTKSIIHSAKTGYYLKQIWKGGKFVGMKATPIGLSISSLVVFLEWAHVTEKYMAHPLRLSSLFGQKHFAENELYKAIYSAQDTVGMENLIKRIDTLSHLNFMYREELISEVRTQQYVSSQILDDFALQQLAYFDYFNWMQTGMDVSKKLDYPYMSELGYDNLMEQQSRVYDFFCAEEANFTKKSYINYKYDYYGIPVPFKTAPLPPYIEQDQHSIVDEILKLSSSWNVRGFTLDKMGNFFNASWLCDEEIQKANPEKFKPSTFLTFKLPAHVKYDELINCPMEKRGQSFAINPNHRNYLAVCRANYHQAREKALKSGVLPLRPGEEEAEKIRYDLDEAYYAKYQSFLPNYTFARLAYILRYEKWIEKNLLKYFTGYEFHYSPSTKRQEKGEKVLHSQEGTMYEFNPYTKKTEEINVNLPKNMFDSLDVELKFIDSLLDGVPPINVRLKLYEYKSKVQTQKDVIKDVVNYYIKNPSERVRSEDLAEAFSEDSFSEMTRIYKNFIQK